MGTDELGADVHRLSRLLEGWRQVFVAVKERTLDARNGFGLWLGDGYVAQGFGAVQIEMSAGEAGKAGLRQPAPKRVLLPQGLRSGPEGLTVWLVTGRGRSLLRH